MKNEFLINPPQEDPQFESCESVASDVPVRITRRSFVKRTGAATIAAMATWDVFSGKALAAAPGMPGHCSIHGSYCTWITNLKASFNRYEPAAAPKYPYTPSGKVFFGFLTYTRHYCLDSSETEVKIPIKTGGYKNTESSVIQNNDTACPDGKWKVTPSTDNPESETDLRGFPIPMSSTGRESILIHGPGVSEGCIVLEGTEEQNSKFYDDIRCHNWPKDPVPMPCIHPGCENPVPIEIVYTTVPQPYGNEPG